MLIPGIMGVRMTKAPGSVPDFGPASPPLAPLTLATRYASRAVGTSETRGPRIRVNTWDAGVDGALITATNSGGANGNAPTINGSKAIFSSAQAYAGLLSAEWNYTGTGSLAQLIWGSLGSNAKVYGSFWIRYEAAPSATQRHVYMTTSGFAQSAFLTITSAGKIQWQDKNQSAIAASLSTNVIAANAWYRIDWAVDTTNSLVYWALYDSTGTSVESNMATGSLGADIGDVRHGPDTFSALTYRFWLDEVNAGTFTSATGVATNHQYTSTAVGTSATSATATGTPTNHQYSSTATATSATSATATGTATNHHYTSTASGTSASSASATGTTIDEGSATGTSATSASATGTATRHQYTSTAVGTSATSATATGLTIDEGTAVGTSATSASATGTPTNHHYTSTASGTSASTATATGTVVGVVYTDVPAGTLATSGTTSDEKVYADAPVGSLGGGGGDVVIVQQVVGGGGLGHVVSDSLTGYKSRPPRIEPVAQQYVDALIGSMKLAGALSESAGYDSTDDEEALALLALLT